jgi:hypothetical protein
MNQRERVRFFEIFFWLAFDVSNYDAISVKQRKEMGKSYTFSFPLATQNSRLAKLTPKLFEYLLD